MSDFIDALRHRDWDKSEGVIRDLRYGEIEALLGIAEKLDLHNSYVDRKLGDVKAKVVIGIHSSESRLGVLPDIDPDEAAELVTLLHELPAIIRQLMSKAE
jgi:hypothetical protein